MWTDGIVKDVTAQSFDDPVAWSKHLNREADAAESYKPGKKALESMRVADRYAERRPYLDAVEQILAAMQHGDVISIPAAQEAYDHIRKCCGA